MIMSHVLMIRGIRKRVRIELRKVDDENAEQWTFCRFYWFCPVKFAERELARVSESSLSES
jgi:hypothetical protein